MKPRLILVILLNCCVQTLSAQVSPLWSPAHSFQRFRYENGLADNYITCMLQDGRGFLWISTKEGLNRFDGSGFKRYYPSRISGRTVASDLAGMMGEYRKDHMIIVTNGGLIDLNTVDETFTIPKDPLLNTAIPLGMLTEINRTWIGVGNKLIEVDSFLTVKKITIIDTSIGTINMIHRLKDRRMVVSSNAGFYFFDPEKQSITSLQLSFRNAPPLRGHLISYYDNQANSLYVSTWDKGVYIFNFDNNELTHVEVGGSKITSIVRKDKESYWVGTQAGLHVYDSKTWRLLAVYKHDPAESPSLVSSGITYLYQDREDNLWIGTFDGLSKLSKSALSVSYIKNELSVNGGLAEIYDIVKGADKRMYIATYGNGCFSIDSSGSIRNIGRNLVPHAWSVTRDNNKIIVTGHDDKLFRFDAFTAKTEPLPLLRPYSDTGDLVTFSFVDHSGGKWYSINKQMGLFYQPAGGRPIVHFSNKDIPAPFSHSYFIMAVEDRQNTMWFASNKSDEFVSYEPTTNKFQTHSLTERVNLRLPGITCMLADDSILWIGTDGGGLVSYNPASQAARLYTTDHGLSGNNVESLALDREHRLWMGTTKGMSCLPHGAQRFLSFGLSDGLPDTYFNEGAIYYDSAANRLYSGARFSLIYFNPDQLVSSTVSIKPLRIDELVLNGEKLAYSSFDRLVLPYDPGNLQITYTAIDFENPGSIRYYYKMEGLDHDWVDAGTGRLAVYSRLREGKYRFLVKAIRTGSQVEMNAAIPFTIVIEPPYWRTWWFRTLIIIGAVCLIYIITRLYYGRKLERQRLDFEKQQAIEQERTRIATDMHDDLGAGLSRIKFLSQSLNNKKHTEESVKAALEKITGYSDEMAEKMGEIVWALNEKNDTLADLVAYTRSYAMEYLANHDIACDVDTPLHLPGTFIPGELRRNIFLAVKECLHNIIKHSGASRVSFYISLGEQIEIIIHDNGKGFERPAHGTGNGLYNIDTRMKEVGGRAVFLNERGTRVQLRIPIDL
jgi:signal transduction histidine kinase/ligand-binding sensor domain-containing protein